MMRAAIAAAVLGSVTWLVGCGPSGPPEPGEEAFHEASRKIITNSEGAFHGNTPAATDMAQRFSEAMATADKEIFTGHKERSFSLTDEEFVTYCQVSGDKICFLVHVPQLKRYKDDVRDTLIELTWIVANHAIAESGAGPFSKVGVGLRGSIVYGGLAIGPPGEKPAETENSAIVDDDKLYEFFVEKTPAAAEEPASEESAEEPVGAEPEE